MTVLSVSFLGMLSRKTGLPELPRFLLISLTVVPVFDLYTYQA